MTANRPDPSQLHSLARRGPSTYGFPLSRRAVRGTGQRIVAARQAPPRFGGILLVEETQKGVLGVRYQNTVFGSLLKAVPRPRFAAIVERHGGDKYVKGVSSWDHFVTLVFGQLGGVSSLRAVETGWDGPRVHPFQLARVTI